MWIAKCALTSMNTSLSTRAIASWGHACCTLFLRQRDDSDIDERRRLAAIPIHVELSGVVVLHNCSAMERQSYAWTTHGIYCTQVVCVCVDVRAREGNLIADCSWRTETRRTTPKHQTRCERLCMFIYITYHILLKTHKHEYLWTGVR